MISNNQLPSLLRGGLAGIAGGLAGGWMKLQCEHLLPPRADGRAAPPAVLLEKTANAAGLAKPESGSGVITVHYAMSAMFGALYGTLSEAVPLIRAGGGIGYGLAVWIGAHEIALPALGLSPPARMLPRSEHVSEAFSHAGFGAGLELTRKFLRAAVLRDGDAA